LHLKTITNKRQCSRIQDIRVSSCANARKEYLDLWGLIAGSSYSLTYRTSIAGGFQLLDNTWRNQHNMSSSWTLYALHHGSLSGKLGHQ